MTTTIGSLCSGYGGLDQGAEAVTGGTTVWHCEYDTAPSAILAHRYPDIPNYGDLKALEWADDPVDVLTAGYPCQPFSGAGKRLGTDDPRHLFPWIVQGVERMRPELLLFENVRGHLSLGFDVVLAELDRIGYDVRWTLLRAADIGAPHGRSRLWIAGRDRDAGGWPTPAGLPTALAEDGGWVDPTSGLFGAIEAQRPGTAGVMVDGARWDGDATVVNAGTLLPTPRTTDTNGAGSHGDGGLDLRTAVSLLPTPRATRGGSATETMDLLPTPRTGSNRASRGALTGTGPGCDNGGEGQWSAPGLEQAIELARGELPREYQSWDEVRGAARMALLPTPEASDGTGGRSSSEVGGTRPSGSKRAITLGTVTAPTHSAQWGIYAAAIARWEALTRPAPAPTERGKNGPRLSPAFVEWMMGLPDGWVTAVPGITRNNALKALGNGVVPQAAAAAYALLGVNGQAEAVAA